MIDLAQQISDSRLKVDELEKARRALEGELEVALTSSTASSDQLQEAKTKGEEAAVRAEKEREQLLSDLQKLKDETQEKEKALRLLREERDCLADDLENKMSEHKARVSEKEEQMAKIEVNFVGI